MLKMDSSSSSLSSDWDIVSPTSVISEESIEESPNEVNEEPPNAWENEKECPSMGSAVDDINDADIGNQNDSNTSSDIDVIEETAEDLIQMSIPTMEYSINSSISVDSAAPSPPTVPVEEGWSLLFFVQLFQRLLRDSQIKDYLVIFSVSVVIVSTVHFQGAPQDKMKEMKDQVEKLKKENDHLKNQVISSKMEDDKLFLILEEQIKAMRSENQKLSYSMQSLIKHMEEQTAILREENEKEEKDPYKEEIDKLKEQVNLLQIDNEELQKQLVRMRYGAYAQNPERTNENESGKDKIKQDKSDDPNEKVPHMLVEEIEKLKKKLYAEVNDLKDWKGAINKLVKRLNLKENRGQESEGSFENKRATDEKFRKYNKEESHKKPNKEQAFYNWSWQDLKKNFKDTFDNINVSDMFSKYASDNKKKVKGYFDSVNHYFKKAQEKTEKMLNGKDDVWKFLGDLRKKWGDMKDEFFKNNFKNGPVPPDSEKPDQKGDRASSFSDKSRRFQGFHEEKRETHFKTTDHHTNKPKMGEANPNKEDSTVFEDQPFLNPDDPEWMFKLNSIMEKQFGPEWRAEMERLFEEDIKDENNEYSDKHPEDQSNSEGTWMFNRAAGRSNLRESDDQEDSTNWFLRRKKTAKGDFEEEE